MHYLNVWLTVKDPTDIEKVRDLLAEAGRRSRLEPGCERFEVYHSTNDPSRFLLHEWWTTKGDWEIHKTAAAVNEIYIPQVLPLVVRDGHPSELVT